MLAIQRLEVVEIRFDESNQKELVVLLTKIKKKLAQSVGKTDAFEEGEIADGLRVKEALIKRISQLLLVPFNQKSLVLEILFKLFDNFDCSGTIQWVLPTFLERLKPGSKFFYNINDDIYNEAIISYLIVSRGSDDELRDYTNVIAEIIITSTQNACNKAKEAGCKIAANIASRHLMNQSSEKQIVFALAESFTKARNLASIKVECLQALSEIIKIETVYDESIGRVIQEKVLHSAFDSNYLVKQSLAELISVGLCISDVRKDWGQILVQPLLSLLDDKLNEVSLKAQSISEQWGKSFQQDGFIKEKQLPELESSEQIDKIWTFTTEKLKQEQELIQIKEQEKNNAQLNVKKQEPVSNRQLGGGIRALLSKQSSSAQKTQQPITEPYLMPFIHRPSSEARNAVYIHIQHVMNSIRIELDTPDETRREHGLGLLRMLLLFCDVNFKKFLPEAVLLLHKQMIQPRIDKSHRNGEYCCALIGLFFTPDAYVPSLVRERPSNVLFETLIPIIQYSPVNTLLELDIQNNKETNSGNIETHEKQFSFLIRVLCGLCDELHLMGRIDTKESIEYGGLHPCLYQPQQFTQSLPPTQTNLLASLIPLAQKQNRSLNASNSDQRQRSQIQQLSSNDDSSSDNAFRLLCMLIDKCSSALSHDEKQMVFELLLRLTATEDLQQPKQVLWQIPLSFHSNVEQLNQSLQSEQQQSASSQQSLQSIYSQLFPKRYMLDKYISTIQSQEGKNTVGNMFRNSLLKVTRNWDHNKENIYQLRFLQQIILRSGSYIKFFIDELIPFIDLILGLSELGKQQKTTLTHFMSAVPIRHIIWETLFLISSKDEQQLIFFTPYVEHLLDEHFIITTTWKTGILEEEIRLFSSSFFFNLLRLRIHQILNPSLYNNQDLQLQMQEQSKIKENSQQIQEKDEEKDKEGSKSMKCEQIDLSFIGQNLNVWFPRLFTLMDDDKPSAGTRLSSLSFMQLILNGTKSGQINGIQLDGENLSDIQRNIFDRLDDVLLIKVVAFETLDLVTSLV